MTQADPHTCRVPIQISEVRQVGSQYVRVITAPRVSSPEFQRRIEQEALAVLEKALRY